MNEEAERGENDIFHERANHEDSLHLGRLNLFLTFNGFLAVAVGFLDDNWPKIFFAFVGLFFNVFWILWSQNAGVFIRELRDAGKSRVDEVLWNTKIRRRDEKYI